MLLVSGWLKALITGLEPNPDDLSCPRNHGEHKDLCDGRCSTTWVALSLPAMLVVEFIAGDRQWTAQAKLPVLSKATTGSSEVIYDLAARIFYLPRKNHFVMRTAMVHNGTVLGIYDHDGLENGGYATQIHGGKLETHLAGTHASTHPPPGSHTQFIVYALHHASHAQQVFLDYQTRVLETKYNVRFELPESDTSALAIPAARIWFEKPGVRNSTEDERIWYGWTSRHRSETIDYDSASKKPVIIRPTPVASENLSSNHNLNGRQATAEVIVHNAPRHDTSSNHSGQREYLIGSHSF